MTALAVSGVSTGWATGGPATAAGLCETVTIDVLPCLPFVVPRADGDVAAQGWLRTSVAARSPSEEPSAAADGSFFFAVVRPDNDSQDLKPSPSDASRSRRRPTAFGPIPWRASKSRSDQFASSSTLRTLAFSSALEAGAPILGNGPELVRMPSHVGQTGQSVVFSNLWPFAHVFSIA